MLQNVDSTIFTGAESIGLVPVVSAEWNQNLFNPPYLTVAGPGTELSLTLMTGTADYANSNKSHQNLGTLYFTTANGEGLITYGTTVSGASAYKIVTYVKTDSPIPMLITAQGYGDKTHSYGSEQAEVSSLGWTKLVTYIGSTDSTDLFSGLNYSLYAKSLSGETTNTNVYFTVPKVYETTYFDYQNHSLWPTESPFTYFRPAESYVSSGDTNCSFPSNYRKITSQIIKNSQPISYSPISSITQNPQFFLASPPIPTLTGLLPTDISSYKYFVSDKTSKSITAVYEKSITTNKLVLKFNTNITVPTIQISINGTTISVDGSQNITLPTNNDAIATGLLTLYWTGSAWTKTKWSNMPKFNSAGVLSKYTTLNKITVTQVSKSVRSMFSSYYNESDESKKYSTEDMNRMQLIEVSPRLEIDISDFIQDLSISKSLDGSNNILPISSMNTNTIQMTLSGIPGLNGTNPVPIFSSQSDNPATILAGLLRKNIKFYINFNLFEHSTLGGAHAENQTTYIPGGVFYSDSWIENDIQSGTIQGFDVSRYLQSMPAPDYVANLKTVFQIITNILDLSGFTDYDYDGLYKICNNKYAPMDISYFYCNSKDKTILGILNEIFVAYQIGAYIDEYGIMRFLSLHDILSETTYNLQISDSDILQNGFSISNNSKPGKISLRYQSPKVKQSPSLQNVSNPDIKNTGSFVFTTSNDVVWQQQNIDSVGFNYIDASMMWDSNTLSLNVNDLLDIFHTFNLDGNGYVFVNNEIMSFAYKQYIISRSSGQDAVTVNVKNNLELSAEINKFIKEYEVGLRISDGETKEDYDVVVTPTGNITNVQRGLFGTKPTSHFRIISSILNKNLSEVEMDSSFIISSGTNTSIINDATTNTGNITDSLPSIDKVRVAVNGNHKTLVFPNDSADIDYGTYSVKFDMPAQDVASAGLFFNMASATSSSGAFFVELVRYNIIDPKTTVLSDPAKYNYRLIVSDSDGTVHAWTDVTGECNSILSNFSKIINKKEVNGKTVYSYIADQPFNLKVVHYVSDGTDGENATVEDPKQVLCIFLNNIEIIGWQIPGQLYNENTNPTGTGWKPTAKNSKTGMRQKPIIPNEINTNTRFGFFASTSPTVITNLHPYVDYPNPTSIHAASLREIHATKKPLKERSVSYFYQDREFLNGLIQGRPLYNSSPTYLMQTTPEVAGINYYDVQYTTPAAVSVDVLPVEYMWYYVPGTGEEDQKQYQKKLIDEYSLAYSTPINTGFRAKMAIANNSSNMVFLHKDADSLDQFAINLNLWTHEIVAPSDPEIIEKIIDYTNISEVAQLDSEWIQSKEAAYKTLKLIEMSIDGFSKDVSLNIFGNPLLQVGDRILLNYTLNGISNQRYIITSVSHNFNQGLSTQITLNRL